VRAPARQPTQPHRDPAPPDRGQLARECRARPAPGSRRGPRNRV